MRSVAIVSVAAVLVLLPASLAARTWYVKADGSGDAPTIQAGVDSSGVGDTVLVAAGTYYENVSVSNKRVAIIGENGAEQTIIDAQFQGRPMRCFMTSGGVVLKGFTLTNGNATDDGGGGLLWFSFTCASGWCEAAELIVKDNRTDYLGGGICWHNDSGNAKLRDCVVHDNVATEGGGGIYAVTGWDVGVSMSNMTIADNAAPSGAGIKAMTFSWAAVRADNSIVAFNDGIGVYCETSGSGVGARCADVWGNSGGNFGGLLSDWTGTNGNISVDPLFCNPAGRDFRLDCASPCLPGNHPDGYDCGLIGAFGVGCGPSATQKTTWGAIKAIYR